MQTFIVQGKNRPGEMAKLTGVLASRNVNVLITALGIDGHAVAAFVTSDESTAQTVLKDAGYRFQSFPAVTIRLTDKPDQAVEISRLLGDQDVNIECFLPVRVTDDHVIVAIGCDNVEAAKKALDEHMVEFSYS